MQVSLVLLESHNKCGCTVIISHLYIIFPTHILSKKNVQSKCLKSRLRVCNWNRKIEPGNNSFGQVAGYPVQP